MSNLYMAVRRTTISDIIVSKKCDICGKDIPPAIISYRGSPRNKVMPYFEITTSHHDWGNDSVDSIEEFDACSPECATKFASEYLSDNFNGHHSKEITIVHHGAWFFDKDAASVDNDKAINMTEQETGDYVRGLMKTEEGEDK